MNFTDHELERQRHANEVHELQQRIQELEGEVDELRKDAELVWPTVNRRRCDLIEHDISGRITDADLLELGILQAYTDRFIQRVAPLPTEVIEQAERQLAELGIGTGAGGDSNDGG